MAETSPAISATNLTKAFGKNIAVDHISFEVPEGVVYGLLGPNGAGKTTTLRMLSTVIKPTEGTAIVAGHDICTEPLKVRENIGVLPEETGLYDRLTPVETLIFYGKLRRMNQAELTKNIDELLPMLGLDDKRNEKVGTFSRGMKQKVALLRAILHKPRLLFLDEPTNGLDVVSARDIRDFITKQAAEGKTVVLSTHNMWEAEKLCQSVGIVNKGKIAATGTIRDLESLTHEGALEEVFIHLVKGEQT